MRRTWDVGQIHCQNKVGGELMQTAGMQWGQQTWQCARRLWCTRRWMLYIAVCLRLGLSVLWAQQAITGCNSGKVIEGQLCVPLSGCSSGNFLSLQYHIGVRVVSPRWPTQDLRPIFATQVLQNEEFKNEVLSRTPMKRIGTPDEVAGEAIWTGCARHLNVCFTYAHQSCTLKASDSD
jgi:hypothetical protein